jgi:hypothetical protein
MAVGRPHVPRRDGQDDDKRLHARDGPGPALWLSCAVLVLEGKLESGGASRVLVVLSVVERELEAAPLECGTRSGSKGDTSRWTMRGSELERRKRHERLRRPGRLADGGEELARDVLIVDSHLLTATFLPPRAFLPGTSLLVSSFSVLVFGEVDEADVSGKVDNLAGCACAWRRPRSAAAAG